MHSSNRSPVSSYQKGEKAVAMAANDGHSSNYLDESRAAVNLHQSNGRGVHFKEGESNV